MLTDRVFVAKETEVHGISKKGKYFFNMTTLMTENIKSMYIEELNLYLAGDHSYSHYVENKDTDYYLAGDVIRDLHGMHLPEQLDGASLDMDASVLLACNDRCIRIIKGSQLQQTIETIDPVITLAPCKSLGKGARLLYGSSTGGFGLVDLAQREHQHEWAVKDSAIEGGVSSLVSFDINEDGVDEVVVGRDDGVVDVYVFEDPSAPPVRIASHQLNAAVSTVVGGRFRSEANELVVSTYSGFVLGLSTGDQSELVVDTRSKIETIKTQLAELQGTLASLRQAASVVPEPVKLALMNVQEIPVLDKFFLNETDASYHLTLELESSIEMVMLQSDVPLDLLDMKDNPAIVSFTQGDPRDGNCVLATYRCQPGTTKMSLKIRSIEGQSGTLQAYIIPNLQPKTCQLKRFSIKALSFHQRCADAFDHSKPYSELTITGAFSFSVMAMWLALCVPDVPARISETEEATLVFRSAFLGTMLECTILNGKAVFRSDNVSTISIVEDFMSKEATKKSVPLNSSHRIAFETIPTTLERLHPKLEQQLMLAKKVELIPALEELKMQEGGADFMSPEYLDIIDNASALQFDFKQQPCHLERLYGMVTDLYIDKYKYKGKDGKQRVAQLVDVLDHYSPAHLLAFFDNENFK